MSGLTYDTGALLASEANRRDIWALHARALQRGLRPVVPTAVLAQAWRGGPQASLSRLLRGCRIEDLTEARARRTGHACRKAATSDIVDATLVLGALERADLVVTSDPEDLRRIAKALGGRLQVHRI